MSEDSLFISSHLNVFVCCFFFFFFLSPTGIPWKVFIVLSMISIFILKHKRCSLVIYRTRKRAQKWLIQQNRLKIKRTQCDLRGFFLFLEVSLSSENFCSFMQTYTPTWHFMHTQESTRRLLLLARESQGRLLTNQRCHSGTVTGFQRKLCDFSGNTEPLPVAFLQSDWALKHRS